MGYAYVTDGGILHVIGSLEYAKKADKMGGIVETDMPFDGGYPIDSDGERVVMGGIGLYKDTDYETFEEVEKIAGINDLYTACINA